MRIHFRLCRSHGTSLEVTYRVLRGASLRDIVSIMVTLHSSRLTMFSSLARACLVLMVYFARYLWPGPSMMWFGSFTYVLAERSLAWRLSHSQSCLERLPVYLTPTQLQFLTPHHAMLSWITMPTLRDRMLQCYGSGRSFDTVWLTLMSHAVVELEDISTILTDVDPGSGFMGVWNIFDAISGNTGAKTCDETDDERQGTFKELTELDRLGLLRVYRMNLPDSLETCDSPASPNGSWDPVPLDQLLSSQSLAQRLYYHLELYNAHKCWRIDPNFFEKFPNLKWSGYEKYIAKGQNLRRDPGCMEIPSRESVSQILFQYQLALMSMDPSAFL